MNKALSQQCAAELIVGGEELHDESSCMAILQSCPDGLLLLDMSGRPVWCNQALLDLFALPAFEQLRLVFEQGGQWPSRPVSESLEDRHQPDLHVEAGMQSARTTLQLRDGRWFEQRVYDHLVVGRKVGLVVQLRDVSDTQELSAEAAHQRELMDALINTLPDPIYFKDEQARFIRVNPSMALRLGLSDPLQALGHREDEFVSADQAARAVAEEQDILRSGKSVMNRMQQEHWADGRMVWSLVTRMPLRNSRGEIVGTFGVARDVSEQKRNEALIWEQANFDALTGLPNRRMLRDRWEQASRHAQRNGLGLALMMLDLDHFKDVNDTLGHARGDELLIESAQRIKSSVRDADVVARLGGDEFCIILTDLSVLAHVGNIAQKIVNALAMPFQLGNDQAFVSASVGISLFPDDGLHFDALFQQADQALYDAKEHGRNSFRFFTKALQTQAIERQRLGYELRQALARDEFFLVYQPIVNLTNGRVEKAEALLRWRHPKRGVLGPRDFILIAESCGLATDIGEWVFRAAAIQLQDWRQRISPDLQLSINKSPLQAGKPRAKLQIWSALLQSLGLPRDAIMVEITESQLDEPVDRVEQHLQVLRELGLSVSLDDFGTGTSSMAKLQSLAIDCVKIDQSFVQALGEGDKSLALCKAIIGMAHELGMQVVAEGVETAQQLELLKEASCDYAQGYFFGRPMPADAMASWLQDQA